MGFMKVNPLFMNELCFVLSVAVAILGSSLVCTVKVDLKKSSGYCKFLMYCSYIRSIIYFNA